MTARRTPSRLAAQDRGAAEVGPARGRDLARIDRRPRGAAAARSYYRQLAEVKRGGQDPHAHGRRRSRRDDAVRDPRRPRSRHPGGRQALQGAELSGAELDHLAEIFCSNSRFTGVDIGDEVVLSFDGCGSQDLGTRINDLQYYEQYLCADSLELYHHDYSYKPAKAVTAFEQVVMRQAQFVTTAPLGYGAMPDLGLYTVPDGPVPNWSELLPLGKIAESRAAQEEAVELAAADIVFVADEMVEAGIEFIDLDTAGAAGDADFLASLLAIERIRARHPDLGIQIGMAGEFVLGMHGELEYEGVRLAGLWPLDQMRLAARAGATIFGPAINVNTGKLDRLERRPHADDRQAVLRRGDRARASERRHGRGRRAHARHCRPATPPAGPRGPPSTSCGSTACRWAPATSTARP